MSGFSLAEALQPAHWPTFVLVSARIIGLMLVAPLWSLSNVPKTVRAALIVVITMCILPSVTAVKLPDEFLALPIPLVTELLIGVAIGLVAAVFHNGIAMAGEVAALQMGLNLGESLAPVAEGSVTGVGELQSMFAMVIYVTIGGHLTLLAGLGRSFELIPPGGMVDFASGSATLIALMGTVFSTAVRAAAPIMAALLLANFAMAILSRAVPQLNAMAVAFPITIGIGLLVLGGSLTFVGAYINGWTGGLGGQVDGVLRAFTPIGVR